MNVDLLNLTLNEFYAKETYKLEDDREGSRRRAMREKSQKDYYIKQVRKNFSSTYLSYALSSPKLVSL